MDKTQKNASILKHIVRYCEEIKDAHNYFGNTYEEFQNNKHYFKSVAMSLLQIGELANHLSKEFQEKYKSIPYAGIISLRNIVAHGYGELKPENMWKISQINTSILQKQCQEILEEIENKNTRMEGQK